jgi:hypothetical protein
LDLLNVELNVYQPVAAGDSKFNHANL